MKFRNTLAAMAMLLSFCAGAQVTGSWKGALEVGSAKLNLVFHIEADGCSLDSPDQGATGIPGEVIYNAADSVSLAFKALGASYDARLRDGNLDGVFKQRGMSFPLSMQPGEIVRNRPQTPQPPFPYTTEDLTFGGEGGAVLCGTLTLARGAPNAPLVVMVSGSGQQNRDEELFGHKPFAVIADYLARQGISSFRYDDRGVGCSTGLDSELTTAVNAGDAYKALKMLRDKGVATSYGILGHSEGGMIGFDLTAEVGECLSDFVVALAGPALPGADVLRYQYRKIYPQITDEEMAAALAAARATGKWMEYFIDYDPRLSIRLIDRPVMALYGGNDVQVDAVGNQEALLASLRGSGKDFVKTYPGLNHLFQHCTTGEVSEYGQIEETISPEVLGDIATWILSVTGRENAQ